MASGEFDRLQFDLEYSSGDYQAEARARLIEAPQVAPASKFFWRVFMEMSSERGIGMDTGPIPFSSVMKYADEFKLQGVERETLLRIIRALDNRFLVIRAEKQRRADEKAKSKSPGSGQGTVIDSW